jgi:hypothetical protein
MTESTIRLREFTGPQNKEVGSKLMGMVNRLTVHQATATDANLALCDKNAVPVCLEAGKIRDLWVLFAGAALAAAETMSVDIHKSTDNGATYATILSAPKVFNNTTGVVGTRLSLMSLLANASVGLSDRLRVVLDYTAGGAPTPVTSTVVVCDITPDI